MASVVAASTAALSSSSSSDAGDRNAAYYAHSSPDNVRSFFPFVFFLLLNFSCVYWGVSAPVYVDTDMASMVEVVLYE